MRTIKLHHSFSFNQILDELNYFKNEVTLHPNYIFRGQTNDAWTLKPSFTRIAIQRNLNRKEALQLERECVNKFVLSAKNLLLPQQTLPITFGINFELLPWLVWMQHYSAPTRKLDWSTSSLVALYFSCCNDIDFDGSVWIADFHMVTANALNTLNIDEFVKGLEDPNSQDVITITSAGIVNERLEAQQGKFTVCTNPIVDHQKILSDIGALTKIIVPKEIKIRTMNKLFQMNINYRTLFPGIDGLGKSIYEYCQLWDKSSIIT